MSWNDSQRRRTKPLGRKEKYLKKQSLEIDENDLCLPFVFDLPSDRLKFVDEIDQIYEIQSALEAAELVGMDTETKPDFSNKASPHPVALLQLAVRERGTGREAVFVVDLLALLPTGKAAAAAARSRRAEAEAALAAALAPLLGQALPPVGKGAGAAAAGAAGAGAAAARPLIVGHGLRQDLGELRRDYPGLWASPQGGGGGGGGGGGALTLEVHDLHLALTAGAGEAAGGGGGGGTAAAAAAGGPGQGGRRRRGGTLGLKALSRRYLYCNLVKAQQCSDWARRPLTQAQLHYAACDALVPLRLLDALRLELAAPGGGGGWRAHARPWRGGGGGVGGEGAAGGAAAAAVTTGWRGASKSVELPAPPAPEEGANAGLAERGSVVASLPAGGGGDCPAAAGGGSGEAAASPARLGALQQQQQDVGQGESSTDGPGGVVRKRRRLSSCGAEASAVSSPMRVVRSRADSYASLTFDGPSVAVSSW